MRENYCLKRLIYKFNTPIFVSVNSIPCFWVLPVLSLFLLIWKEGVLKPSLFFSNKYFVSWNFLFYICRMKTLNDKLVDIQGRLFYRETRDMKSMTEFLSVTRTKTKSRSFRRLLSGLRSLVEDTTTGNVRVTPVWIQSYEKRKGAQQWAAKGKVPLLTPPSLACTSLCPRTEQAVLHH